LKNLKLKAFRKIGILSTLFFILIMSNFALNDTNVVFNEVDRNVNPRIYIIESSSYQSNSSSDVTNVSGYLHQAYSNSTITKITEINSSIEVPAPNATNYLSSYVNISATNIVVSNHSETIESSTSAGRNLQNLYAASFVSQTECYLSNTSVSIEKDLIQQDDGTLSVYLFNSTWTGSASEPVIGSSQNIGTITVDIDTETWYNISFGDSVFLNNSETENNTWFIGLQKNTGGFNFVPYWRYESDASNGDNSYSYIYTGSLTSLAVDFATKISLSLNKSQVKPSEISLDINNTAFHDISDSNSGFWNKTGDAG